jgi:hypothetical protein
VRPDFSLMTDYISELGERGSSTELIVNYAAFILTGALYVGFAAALGVTFAGRWGCALAAALMSSERSALPGLLEHVASAPLSLWLLALPCVCNDRYIQGQR